jgi:hypothetical protein
MDKIYEFSEDRNITFYPYKGKQLGVMKDFVGGVVSAFNKGDKKAKDIIYFKSYRRCTALVMFSLLMNDDNINDINYSFNDMSNFVSTANNNVEVLNVTLNCQYTQMSEYLKQVVIMMEEYVEEKQTWKES